MLRSDLHNYVDPKAIKKEADLAKLKCRLKAAVLLELIALIRDW